jgi:anti-sigma factor RsiW
MKCLIEEGFNRYLDNDLDEAEREEFVAHIASCRSCGERLNEMEHLEHRIREGIVGSRLRAERADSGQVFACPSGPDLLGYLDHQLPPPDMKAMERHLGDCDNCIGQLRILSRLKTTLRQQDLESVPPELKDMVLRGWQQETPEREERPQSGLAFRLAIRLVTTGLEILRDSIVPPDMELNLVASPAFNGAFRSVENAPESERNEVLVAKKQVADKDLQIELVIRKESDQQVSLAVQLSKGGSPFSEARVSLFKDRSLFHSKKTDSNGHVEFASVPAGEYVLKISSELIQWPIEIRDH